MSFEFDDNGGIIDKAAQEFAQRKQDLANQNANAVNTSETVVQVFDEVAPTQDHDAEPAIAPSDVPPQDNLPQGDVVAPQAPAEEQPAAEPQVVESSSTSAAE